MALTWSKLRNTPDAELERWYDTEVAPHVHSPGVNVAEELRFRCHLRLSQQMAKFTKKIHWYTMAMLFFTAIQVVTVLYSLFLA